MNTQEKVTFKGTRRMQSVWVEKGEGIWRRQVIMNKIIKTQECQESGRIPHAQRVGYKAGWRESSYRDEWGPYLRQGTSSCLMSPLGILWMTVLELSGTWTLALTMRLKLMCAEEIQSPVEAMKLWNEMEPTACVWSQSRQKSPVALTWDS